MFDKFGQIRERYIQLNGFKLENNLTILFHRKLTLFLFLDDIQLDKKKTKDGPIILMYHKFLSLCSLYQVLQTKSTKKVWDSAKLWHVCQDIATFLPHTWNMYLSSVFLIHSRKDHITSFSKLFKQSWNLSLQNLTKFPMILRWSIVRHCRHAVVNYSFNIARTKEIWCKGLS